MTIVANFEVLLGQAVASLESAVAASLAEQVLPDEFAEFEEQVKAADFVEMMD